MLPHTRIQKCLTLLKNFRFLIGLLVIGALFMVAAAFMAFTQWEVTDATLTAGDKEARNIMKVVKLNMDSSYRDVMFFREYALQRYKAQLRNLVSVIVSRVDYFGDLEKRGILTRKEARRLALESVERTRYGNNDYFFIYDVRNVAISHADSRVRGRDMSALKDDQGRPLIENMHTVTEKQQEGFCTVRWTKLDGDKPVPKLLYFYHYARWDWLIGTGVYIDDIETDVQRKMEQIMTDLKTTFSHVKVSDTGYFFLFGGDKRILIHPTLSGQDGSSIKDVVTGRNHHDELVAASKNPDIPWKYLWNKPSAPENYSFVKYSHVEFFPQFDWYLASSVYEDEMKRPAEIIIRRQLIFVCFVVLFAMIGVYLLVSRVTEPLAKLTRHADRLRKTDFAFSEEGQKDLSAITFPDEVRSLAGTLVKMERRLDDYLRELKETTAAQERLRSELRIAGEIQMSMLPDIAKARDGRVEIELAAALEPAREVGGDLYDCFFLDRERFCFLVGDVSDKGVPAALFMARSKALLRNAALREHASPDRILDAVNQELVDGNDRRMFITVFLAILDCRSGELVYSNAGHIPPVLIGEAAGPRFVALQPGKPLGLTRKASYRAGCLRLRQGEGFLVYTDGISEAQNERKEFFGDDRLLAFLGDLRPPVSAEAAVRKVLREVKIFIDDMPRSDDMAVLCLRWLGEGGEQSGTTEPMAQCHGFD